MPNHNNASVLGTPQHKYGPEHGFKVTNTEVGREFRFRGSGIGLGTFIALTILGALLGFIVGMSGGVPALALVTGLAAAVIASLLFVIRLSVQRFTLTPNAIRLDGKSYSVANISCIEIINKPAGGRVFEAERRGMQFFVGGTGAGGAALAVGSVLSNAASTFGADLRRMLDRSRIKHEYQICIRYGAKLVPVAKYLSENKCLSLFNALTEELSSMSSEAAGSEPFTKPLPPRTAAGTACFLVGVVGLIPIVAMAIQLIVGPFSPLFEAYLIPVAQFAPFAYPLLAFVLALPMRAPTLLLRLAPAVLLVAAALLPHPLLFAVAFTSLWLLLILARPIVRTVEQALLAGLILLRGFWLLLFLGGPDSVPFWMMNPLIGFFSGSAVLHFLQEAIILCLIPLILRILNDGSRNRIPG
jgi:hypothetical protein